MNGWQVYPMNGCLLYPTSGVVSLYRDTHFLHQETGIHVTCHARLQAVREAEFVALYIRLEAVILDGVGDLACMPHER